MYLDPHKRIDISNRNLPHWRQDGVTYFVTFRLADSLPQSKLRAWKIERENFLDTHPKPLGLSDSEEFHSRFTNQIDAWLDAGMGSCVLADQNVSKIVADSMNYFETTRYNLGEWVIMPNHVHAVISPKPGFELEKILHSWKSYSANEINRALNRKGKLWQDES